MLADAELQAIADEYARSQNPQWVGVSKYEMDDPPGLLFIPFAADLDVVWGEGPPREWGHYAFFVHRTNGDFRLITNPEALAAGGVEPWGERGGYPGDFVRVLTVVWGGSEPKAQPPNRPYWWWSGKAWLSDEKLQAIADESIRKSLSAFVAVWKYAMDSPPGVYFEPRHRDWVGKPHDDLREPGVLGTAGLFVYRSNGEVRNFSSGEWAAAARALGVAPDAPPEDFLKVIGLMFFPEDLWDCIDDDVFGQPVLRVARRPWWKFW